MKTPSSFSLLLGFLLLPVEVRGDEGRPLSEPIVLSSDEVAEFEQVFESLTEDHGDTGFVNKGWPKLEVIWKTSSIPVCWENPTQENQWFRSIVQQAVIDTWDSHSKISFSGWEACASNNRGVRIQISDEGPHTKGLGTVLDGKKNGMILNATYKNWSPSCQNRLAYCSTVIAVHEFGHVLGFAHDQNRPDTPEHCNMPSGSKGSSETVSWTPWDEKSVMNYCNPEWSNGGRLSKFDVYLVQRLYGKPQP